MKYVLIVLCFLLSSCNIKSPQEKAKINFNQSLIESKEKSRILRIKLDSLMSIITDSVYYSMYERLGAIKELRAASKYFDKYTDYQLLNLHETLRREKLKSKSND